MLKSGNFSYRYSSSWSDVPSQLYGARQAAELSVLPLTGLVGRHYRFPIMDYPRGYSALTLLVLVAAWSAAAGPVGAAPPSLLLLRNGNVLEGEITQAGDYYVVLLGASEIRLPAREVEAQVASLDEAYELKKFGLFGRGAEPHLKLAEWCLRQGLLDRCGEQLAEAARVEADHPGIASVERRLAQAREPKPVSSQPSAKSASAAAVRSDDVEKAIRALPKASVERFAAVVQPLLLNRCGANQCHGANSKTEFHVLRPPGGQAATQRFTQRNLYAALAYIDRTDPENSPLLALPARQHGSSLVPVFDKQTQRQLEELRAWVRLTVAMPEAAQPTTIPADQASALSQPDAQAAVEQTTNEPAAPIAAGAVASQPKPATQSPATPVSPRKDTFIPRDPFDAEIFNWRFKK